MKKIYSIYDTIAEEFGSVMIFNNDNQAIRYYDMMCDKSATDFEKSGMRFNKSELVLYCLGDLDVSNCSKVDMFSKEAD